MRGQLNKSCRIITQAQQRGWGIDNRYFRLVRLVRLGEGNEDYKV
jgi:hypothetical protein